MEAEVKDQPEVEETAGEVREEDVETATTEIEGSGLGDTGDSEVSIESILSGDASDQDIQKAKNGTEPWIQKRIDEITKQKNIAQKERDDARKELETFKAMKDVPKEQPLPPVESDYDTPVEWQKAMVKWQQDINEIHQAQNKANEVLSQSARKNEENLARFYQRAEALKSKYPDIVERLKEPLFSDSLTEAVMDSEYSAEIGLYLHMNRDKLDKFNGLDQKKLDREIGRLEARIADTGKKTKHITSAPKPLKPVEGSSEPVKKDPSEMTGDEYLAWYNQQKLKKLQQKYGGV